MFYCKIVFTWTCNSRFIALSKLKCSSKWSRCVCKIHRTLNWIGFLNRTCFVFIVSAIKLVIGVCRWQMQCGCMCKYVSFVCSRSLSTSIDPGFLLSPYIALDMEERSLKFQTRRLHIQKQLEVHTKIIKNSCIYLRILWFDTLSTCKKIYLVVESQVCLCVCCPCKPYSMGTKCPHKDDNIDQNRFLCVLYMFLWWDGLGVVLGHRICH